ncbi:MAG: NAD(+) synthase, partial [Ruminiclostridium sp.]
MKDGFIKIGAATPKIKVGDCAFNSESIISAIKDAYEKGVRLLALPELCVTGYTCGDLFYQSVLLNGAWSGVERIVAETADLDMVSVIGA